MARIKLFVNTGFANANHEDYEELPEGWDSMTEEQREEYLDEIAQIYHDNCIDYGAYVVEGED